MRRISAAATLVVAAFFSSPCPLLAQARHSVSIRPVFRAYSVDTTTVAEQVGGLEYGFTAGRTRLRFSASPLRFSDGTTIISGTMPAELVADVRVGHLDTVRLTIRGPSIPGSLSSGQVTALGSVGTGTLDLESAALGTAAGLGLRTSVAGAAGPVILGARFGIEMEPTPASGTDSVYWRGATFRGGVSLTAFAGEFRITLGLDVATSTGDSLNGRNLFPGGGSVVVRGDASGLVGTSATLASFSAFYFRPFGLDQPVQINRLIPTGDFVGLSTALLVPVGGVFLSPTIAFTRESSSAPFQPQTALEINGLGWSASGSLGLDIPLGRGVSLTPEVGVVLGDVTGRLVFSNRTGPPLSSFADHVSGWWGALELSASF